MKKLLLMLFLCVCGPINVFSQANQTLIASTDSFLNTLNSEKVRKTVYDFNDPLHFKWTNFAVGSVPRPGIAYGSLSDQSRLAFHRVLSAMFSSQGYLKTTSIMALDDILNVLYETMFDEKKLTKKH
jgi:hypothetical protein